tara:strand:+ start:2454 stop:2864 length:411 start_codon:yes stop_codon:yes gene_type:complete
VARTKKTQFHNYLRQMRLDKFTWAMRLYKTRSIAATACNKDKVKLNNNLSKPGKTVSIGNTIAIKDNPIWRSFKIHAIPKSRVGAKLVADYIIETTTEAELSLLEEQNLINQQQKNFGWGGRPTKKDRRDIDRLKD